MSGTLYRRPQPGGLADLLNMGAEGAPPVAPQVASPTAPVTDQGRQRLLDALFQQPDLGPAPPESKPDTITNRLGPTLADALTAYASAIAANPSLKTNFLGQYRARQDRSQEDRRTYDQRKAALGDQAKRGAAQYELGRIDSTAEKTQMAQDALQGKKELRDQINEQRKYEADARAQSAADAIAARQDEITSREKIAKMETDARIHADNLQANLQKKRLTDEGDKEQHSEYAKARQFVVAKKNEYAQLLADGKITPEQIRQEWQDTLDSSDLTGDYKAAADAFWQSKIGSMLFGMEHPRFNDAMSAR